MSSRPVTRRSVISRELAQLRPEGRAVLHATAAVRRGADSSRMAGDASSDVRAGAAAGVPLSASRPGAPLLAVVEE